MFTGSGMPHALRDRRPAQMIDVYQAATQMTDESGQTYPAARQHAARQRDRTSGYYGAFTANMHTDFNPSNGQTWSDAIVNVGARRATCR